MSGYGGGYENFQGHNVSPSGFAPSGAGGFMQGEQESLSQDMRQKDNRLSAYTIRQLLNAKSSAVEAEMRIDGMPVEQVTVVGILLNVSRSTTCVNGEIEDGTGTISFRFWVNEDDMEELKWERKNLYVRLFGAFSTSQKDSDTRALNIQRVRIVEDHNEITYHLADCIRSHLRRVRGPSAAAPQADTSMMDASSVNLGQSAYAQPTTFAGGNAAPAADLQSAIVNLIGNCQEEAGISYNSVVEGLQSLGFSVHEHEPVASIITDLINDGHIFQTIDDYHFKAA
mmetsp:Transcript_16591/g.46835  ORF Transcript_16591/g.46835 Transcript_16591/m.46835 type:complete len:284 (-) Transcript_16591:36-887(-)|eukprot:CAMPEP_0119133242 /NCGR_PEP_ID=MMETSP1310-20130426/13274_1 /TAXON_ID=464262 /ORGANISM="Genus nov. species nov., Strain RCC2339" /LENGTH=283 /DNA_ID=CAMNT_0007123929 /DNA_START=97 /DNA_END=948 /DNA_ORIENTATION=+